jgi:hypothetical protein
VAELFLNALADVEHQMSGNYKRDPKGEIQENGECRLTGWHSRLRWE